MHHETTIWPSIDHSTLSPSGTVSKRSRRAAQERAHRLLFPDGGLTLTPTPQPSERDSLLRKAAELRALAARGMKPRAYAKEAARLEALAAQS